MRYGNARSKNSHRFRPTICAVLEERNLLSTLTVPSIERSGGVAIVHKAARGLTAQKNGHSTEHRGQSVKALAKSVQKFVSTPAAPDVLIRKGYSLTLLSSHLAFPDSITFGPNGKMWIADAGIYSDQPPAVEELHRDGSTTQILSASQLSRGAFDGPLTDITYHQGWIWVTHLQQRADGMEVGAISKFRPKDPVATFKTVITNLPSFGGAAAGYPFKVVFDAKGRAYFSIGSVTNSGVVDAAGAFQPTAFHDYPPVPVVLNGTSYTTPDPLSNTPGATAVTSPFKSFGSGAVAPGTIVRGVSPAHPENGLIAGSDAVYSFNPNARNATSTLRLVAWGFRQPYGLSIDPLHPSDLYVTNNGIDTFGGTRIVNNDHDSLFRIRINRKPQFYGWPDYFHDPKTGKVLPVSAPVFAFGGSVIQPVFDKTFSRSLKVQNAVAMLGFHVGADQLDFSTSRRFGNVGDMFIAESGAIVPLTGATEFTGYKVVRTDPRTGRTSDFIVHASLDLPKLFDANSVNKPVDVKFRGNKMFVVDFGAFEPGLGLQGANTGKVWVVTRNRPGS